MVTTLCEGVDTLGTMVTFVEDSQEVLFNQSPINQIHVDNIPINHLHVDLLIGPLVDGLHVGKMPISRSLVSQPHVMVVTPWHATIAKIQKLPTHPPINHIGVLIGVVVVRNQEDVFHMKGVS